MVLFKKSALVVMSLAFMLQCGTEENSQLTDLQNAKEITLQDNGEYKIVCKDGRTETATLTQIQNDEICLPSKTGWVLSSGTFQLQSDKKSASSKECAIILKTYFYENNLHKVKINGNGCKIGELEFHQCKHSQKKTTCINSDTKSEYKKFIATSHQHFELTHDSEPKTFKQSSTSLFNGIIQKIKESNLAGWKRCFTTSQTYTENTLKKYPSRLKSILSACGGPDASMLVGCMSRTEFKSSSPTLSIGAVIPSKALLDELSSKKLSFTSVVNNTNFYLNKNRAFGFYPIDAKVTFKRGYDENTDNADKRFSFYIRSQSSTDAEIYYPKRCGNDKTGSSSIGVFYKQN